MTKIRKTLLLLALLVVISIVVVLYAFLGLGGPSVQDDIVADVWAEDLIDAIPVAIDITPDGGLFIVETGKFSTGAGDNRYQNFWLLDDRASMHIRDREAYIRKWIAAGELTEDWFTEPVEKVNVLRDTDGDGEADQVTTFASEQGLLRGVIAGVLVKGDHVWVTNIPEVLLYRDSDGDDEADERKVLSRGYGLRTAFVGHDLHGLTWGPDGKIYFSVGDRGFNVTTAEGRQLRPPMDMGRGGVFRMNPDGSDLSLFAVGLRNPQELAFDNYGNLFTGDNNSDGGDKARIVYVVEGGDSGWSDGYQYQAEEDYLRGPWNAERMWEPWHPGQPAWMVPPVANETSGPSGLAFYPGTGLPERYSNHFFLADYLFAAIFSRILSFEAKPKGAGFTLEDVHDFASKDLFIDQVFGYDGKMYALSASVFGGSKLVRRFYDPAQVDSPVITGMQTLFAEGFEQRPTSELLELLSHVDRRVRQEAQFTLAKRPVEKALQTLAVKPEATEMSRLHALWALGQRGSAALAKSGEFGPKAFDGELRAQFWKVAGDAVADQWSAAATADLAHANPRVRYFAAMALGKFGNSASVVPLTEYLRRIDDSDPYERHAAVYALSKLPLAPEAWLGDPSAAVRLGVLLALRHKQSEALALFLNDPEPSLVLEAARAVYDLGLEGAMPALAAMAAKPLALSGDNPQTDFALHRRVIAANSFVGGSDQAMALAAYAATAENPLKMRKLALKSLAEFSSPPKLDPVIGIYRDLGTRKPETVHPALDEYLPQLMKSPLQDQALALGVAYQKVPLNDDELLALIKDATQALANRVSALEALAGRGETKLMPAAIDAALASREPPLRAKGLNKLAVADWKKGAATAIAMLGDGGRIERQAAIRVLGQVGGSDAEVWLIRAMDQLLAGKLQPDMQWDVLQAAENLDSQPLKQRLADYRSTLDPGNPTIERSVARFGGDPVNGKLLFENAGDCLRCHIVKGRGGNSGPDLTGIASAADADYLLDALVRPGKDIAQGYGMVNITLNDGSTLSGVLEGETENSLLIRPLSAHGEGRATEIALDNVSRSTPPVSGMPPMGLVLSIGDLRDVMAYLQTLK